MTRDCAGPTRDLYPRFEMPESKNITGLANRLAAMVKDMVVPEEK